MGNELLISRLEPLYPTYSFPVPLPPSSFVQSVPQPPSLFTFEAFYPLIKLFKLTFFFLFATGPDEREVRDREQTTRGLIPKFPSKYQPQETETIVELSKTIYTEIFEDADDLSENESNMRSLAQLEDHTDTKNASINDLSNGALLEGPQQDGPQLRGSLSDGPLPSALDTVEDWDKEIEDSLAYNLVLETFKQRSYNKVNFQNQLQNLLYSYPPACQAFTKTANYESAVYSFPAPHLCSDQVSCSLDAGQFDDADEEVLAKL